MSDHFKPGTILVDRAQLATIVWLTNYSYFIVEGSGNPYVFSNPPARSHWLANNFWFVLIEG